MKRHIHAIIMLLIGIVVSYLPPVGSISPFGMDVLGVFLALIYGWLFYDLMWASVCGFVMLGLLNITTVGGALQTSLGNAQVIMMICGMAFAGALQKCQVTDFVAAWLLQRKIIKKSPWFLVASIILIAYILGALGVTTPAVFIIWSVLESIVDASGVKRDAPIVSFISFMIVIAAFTGNGLMPFRVGALLYGGFLENATGLATGYVPYIILVFLTTFPSLILMILAGKYVLRFDASGLVATDEALKKFTANSKPNMKQKYALIFLCLFTALLLVPELLPSLPGTKLLKSFGVPGVAFLLLLIMNILHVDGKPLISIVEVFRDGVQWLVILVVAVVFPVVNAMNSAESGIMITISNVLTPLTDGLGLIPFMTITMLIVAVLSQFTHNIVVGAVLIPLFIPMILESHGIPMALCLYFMFYTSLNCAFATPAACAGAALAFSGSLTQKQNGYIVGTVYFIINMIIAPLICIPLANILW